MKILLAVASCARDCGNGFNQAIRDTWGQDVEGADLRFFTGAGGGASDEVALDCRDGYLGLPEKTWALARWALTQGYSHVFKCDTDTFVRPAEMLASDFHRYDYVGTFNGPLGVARAVYGRCYAWASGGSGYWLSSRALELVAAGRPGPLSVCPRLRTPAEDLWVGQLMGPSLALGELTALHDERYGRSYREDFTADFTAHFCSQGMKRAFDPEWMHLHYEVNR